MKLNQIVKLNEEANQADTILSLIKTGCTPFLNLNMQKPLLKGIKTKKGDALIKTDSQRVENASEGISFLFDTMLQQNTKIVDASSQAIFCTTDLKIAKRAGKPCYIFPVGNAKVVWSHVDSGAAAGERQIIDKILEELADTLDRPTLAPLHPAAIRGFFQYAEKIDGVTVSSFLAPSKEHTEQIRFAAEWDGMMTKSLEGIDAKSFHSAMLKALKNTYKYFYTEGKMSEMKTALGEQAEEIMIVGGYYHIPVDKRSYAEVLADIMAA